MKLAIKLPLASLTSLRGIPDDLGEGVRGPYPAPAGWKWVVIAENGQALAENNQTFVELRRAA